MPRGKLTRNEKYIITGMMADGFPIDDIMEETGRSAQVIEKFLKSLEKEAENKEPEEKPMVPRENKTEFLRHTAVKRDKAVSIMTEGESSRSETTKPKKQSKIVKRFEPVIHKIREEDD